MDRMLLIRARQLALKQGYAVHLTCSSETHLARDSNHWSCCKCGRVPSDEVVSRSSALEEVVADSAYLLAELDKRSLTVHVSVPLVLPYDSDTRCLVCGYTSPCPFAEEHAALAAKAVKGT